MIHYSRWLAKKMWGLFALLLILIALFVQLGRELLPMVAEYRPQIALQMSDQLGMDVSIGAIEGIWEGLSPRLSLTDVVVTTEDDVEVLRVNSGLFQINFLASVLDRRLSWRKVYLSGVTSALQQKTNGEWTLTGLNQKPQPQSASEDDASNLMDAFNQANHVELKDINLNFHFTSGRESQLRLTEMLLENSADFHRLVADIDLPHQEEAFKVIAEGRGDSSDLDTYVFNAYVRLTQFPLSSSAFLSEALADKPIIENSSANLDLWMLMDKPRVMRMQGDASIEVSKASGDIDKLSASIQGHSDLQKHWFLGLNDLKLHWQGTDSPSLNVQLQGQTADKQLNIKAERVDLAPLYQFVDQHQWLQGKLAALFTDLNPQGELHNVSVDLPLDKPADFTLQANLQQVSVEDWNEAPALNNVNGYVYSDQHRGWIDLDSRDGFSMHYPHIYHEPLAYQQAKGQVAWFLDKDANSIVVNSGHLELGEKSGQADGYFFLDLPWVKDSRPSELVLQIGLQDAPANIYKKYVPYVVDLGTREWLDSSIQGGQVPQAGFVYRSYFGKKFNLGGTVQLLVDVEQGHLQYHPDWPAVKSVNARVVEDDGDVTVKANSANLLEGQARDLTVMLSPNPKANGSILNVRGKLQGPAEDGLALLRDTPLRSVLGDQFDSWHLSGGMAAEVDLNIPLTPGQPGERQDVLVSLKKSNLSIESLNIQVADVAGDISFSNRKGLTSQSITGKLWGESVKANIVSRALSLSQSASSQPDERVTQVNLAGKAAPLALAKWSGRPEVLFTEGKIPYQARLVLPPKGTESYSVKLAVDSDLKGVSINLPEPYGKEAAADRSFSLEAFIDEEQVIYDMHYALQQHQSPNQQVHARFDVQQGDVNYGVIGLQQLLDLTDFDKQAKQRAQKQQPALAVTGHAGRIQLNEWQEVLARYEQYQQKVELESKAKKASGGDESRLHQLIDLSLTQLDIEGFELDGLQVKGERLSDGWLLKPSNEMLAGEVTLFDDDRPLALNLKYLHLPGGETEPADTAGQPGQDAGAEVNIGTENKTNEGADIQTSATEDPFADINPAKLVPLDVSLAQVSWGGKDYGSWTFKLRPTDNGLYINDILGQIRGLLISGHPHRQKSEKGGKTVIEHSGGAFLHWENGQQNKEARSYFTGRLQAENFGDVIEAWGQSRSMESQQAIFDLDLDWPGSPAAFGLKTLQGEVGIDIDKGKFAKTAGAGSSAILRLMGLFNFDSWSRRLKLDFSDTYRRGTAFDEIDGRLRFNKGIMVLVEPMVVKTPSAKLSMAGTIDINREELDATLVATLPVGGNLTVIAAFAGGLPAAAGVYAISKIFKSQVDKVASVSYGMKGSWEEPVITFEKLFDSKAAERAGSSAEEQMEPRRESDGQTHQESQNQ